MKKSFFLTPFENQIHIQSYNTFDNDHVIMKLSTFYSFNMQQNATNFVYSINFITVSITYNLHKLDSDALIVS